MLTNAEFSQFNCVPRELSDEMAEFAMFRLDMGEVLDEKTHKPQFPHLLGVNLWEVLPQSEAQERIANRLKDQQADEAKRLANLEIYAARGWAFEFPTEDDNA